MDGNAGFEKYERNQIDNFVQNVMKLKGHAASFDRCNLSMLRFVVGMDGQGHHSHEQFSDLFVCSVLNNSSAFVGELKLFERAASQVRSLHHVCTRLSLHRVREAHVLSTRWTTQDAFSVCSSALKLQFRESLDEELFQAYVQDWKDKRFKLTVR